MRHEQGKFEGAGGVELHYHHWSPQRRTDETSPQDGVDSKADGAGLHVGEAEPELGGGQGRASVLVSHGVAEHAGRYAYVAETLTDRGYDVWAHDHRGHGRSAGSRGYVDRFGTYIADLDAFRLLVAAEQPGPQFLVGHSMGGAVALAHAIDRPGSWTGLVLSNPVVAPRAGAPRSLVLVGRLAALVAPRTRIVQLDAAAVSRDPSVVAAYRDDPLVYHGKLTARLVAELVGRTERFRKEVADLALPVLMLVGGDDQLVPPEGPRELFRRIGAADKRLVEYPGVHHELFNEPERDQVLADVADWLDGHHPD